MISTASFMGQVCSIVRKTMAITASGDQTVTTATTTGVACCVQSASSSEALAEQRESGQEVLDVYFLSGADVKFGDYLMFTSGVNAAKATTDKFEIISEPVDDGGESAYIRVLARRVAGRPPV